MIDLARELAASPTGTWHSLGAYAPVVERTLAALTAERAVSRMWARDASLWSTDATVQADVRQRLGWLDLPTTMPAELPRLTALAEQVRTAGIRRVLLLGMGGSSLAPEVMSFILGAAPGFPDLVALDTTDPTQIRRVAAEVPLEQTLLIAASKSGTTAETNSLYQYFVEVLRPLVGSEQVCSHFIAITDEGTALARLAQQVGMRALFLNPPDLGGRFSALSLYGLVPGALLGADLDKLLSGAAQMAAACRKEDVATNPGLLLGTVMGALATQTPRVDKLTLLASPKLASFGSWAEQLVAESTGKKGMGILPIDGEHLAASYYGFDRLFVYLRLAGDENAVNDRLIDSLDMVGHPCIVLQVNNAYALGAEFFRWEFATALAGSLLTLNPFDQPNVEAAKAGARAALAEYERSHALAVEAPAVSAGALSVIGPKSATTDLSAYLAEFIAQARTGDYVAIMAYVDRCAANEEVLQRLRHLLGQRLHLATTLGYGPRFLHSTGQLHKGGADNGLFVQITHDEADDLAIPGRSYSFGVLKHAQALGDLAALRAAGRRVISINLGTDVAAGLAELERMLSKPA